MHQKKKAPDVNAPGYVARILRNALIVGIVVLSMSPMALGQVNIERYRADQAFENGDHAHAMQMYKDMLDENPNDPELNYNVGNALYKMNQPAEALPFYQRALANAKDDRLRANIEYNMSNALFKSGKVRESIEGYKQVLRSRPDDDDARFNLEFAQKRLDKEKPPPQSDDKNDELDQNKDKNSSDHRDNKDSKDNQSDRSKQNESDKDRSGQPKSGQGQSLSKKDAERILEALKHQEKEYQKKKMKEKANVDSRSEKDW